MTKNKSPQFYLYGCSALILILSYLFTALAFNVPEVMALFSFVMLIPAPLAAVFLFLQTKSLREVVGPIVHPISFGSMIFATLYPLGVIFACALLAQLLGLAEVNWRDLFDTIKVPGFERFILGMLLVFGEEYAWRGYLFPRFSQLYGPIRAASVVGLIWALWHGPLVYGLAIQMKTSEMPLLLTFVQMSVVFLFSFSFSYAYMLSRSVFPVMVFHFVWNWMNPTILGNIYVNNPGLAKGNILLINGEGVFGVLFGLAFAAWFVWKFRGVR